MNDQVLQFLEEKTGLNENELGSVLKRTKFYSFPAKKSLTFTIEDLTNYEYFVMNDEGVVLFSLNSFSGTRWCIFYSANTVLPFSKKTIDALDIQNSGFVCRNTKVLGIRREDIKYLRAKSAKFVEYMEQGVTNLLENIMERQANCQGMWTNERILASIMVILERYGYDLPSGERIVHLSQADLAAISGTTKQNVAKILGDLRKSKVLRTGWKSIIITRKYYESHRILIN